MNSNNSWHVPFIRWVKRELQNIPSSRKLVDLLTCYPEPDTNGRNPEDWVEENLEAALRLIKAEENTFELIDDKKDEDEDKESSIELVVVKLRSELPPRIGNISPPRSEENLQQPPLELLKYQIAELKIDLDSVKPLLDKLNQDIGSRNNLPVNLFEWLRSNEPKINKITEIDSSLTKISRSLALHIGEHDFKCEADTFKTHFDHILFALPTQKWKENGWIMLILGVVVLICGGVTYTTITYKANLENQLKNIEQQIKQLESKTNNQISSPTAGQSPSPSSAPTPTNTSNSSQPGAGGIRSPRP
jgi:hypothetical protein